TSRSGPVTGSTNHHRQPASTREGTARREPDTRGALAPIDLARGRLLPLSIRRRERAPDRDPGIRRGRRTTRGDRGSLLRGGEDGCGTLLEEELRKLDAELLGGGRMAGDLRVQDLRAVGHAAHADELEVALAKQAVSRERGLTAASHAREEAALGGDPALLVGV